MVSDGSRGTVYGFIGLFCLIGMMLVDKWVGVPRFFFFHFSLQFFYSSHLD